MKQTKIMIIGGGAAGIMAAIAAARNNAKVTILEKNSRIGRKILVTGNGRCNYTNINATSKDYNHPWFVSGSINLFGPRETIKFFKELGIEPLVEQNGRVYPRSEQASSIVDVFLDELKCLGVNVINGVNVCRIVKNGSGFLTISTDGEKFESDSVIITTGGMAMPTSGSNGSGYSLAQALGHKLIRTLPALVKLKLESPYLKHLDGVKVQGTAALIIDGKKVDERSGDILFTGYGISGPTILDLSRQAALALETGSETLIRVILIGKSEKIDISKRFLDNPSKQIDHCLIGLINKRLISPLLKEAKIAKHTHPAAALSSSDIDSITRLLTGWDFVVSGTRPFEDAQITVGGIDVAMVDPKTMESTKVPGLYFAGEILDIDGPCGGFNLQWAWTSGHVAGTSAAGNRS